ncbi:MAG: SDR family oxidoreductase [Chloroflexota bacterium]|nr:MAG: SDR family oxidoreductase [Chloroflexota bacterium]
MARLEGKVAVVTGGGSGIGAAAARAFAKEGGAVAVVDVRAEPAEAVAAEIRAAGGRAIALAANVKDEREIGDAVRKAAAEFGGLHVVFANAGINGMQCPIEEMTLDEWRDTIDTNLTGTFLTVKPAIPLMRAHGGGSVIITASVNGNRIWSLPGYSAYSTAKAGQAVWGRMAAVELSRWNIRVNTICPGGVRTNIKDRTWRRNLEKIRWDIKVPDHYPPLHGRPAAPEEIADLVVFLASDESRYITGTEVVIDAASSLLRG